MIRPSNHAGSGDSDNLNKLPNKPKTIESIDWNSFPHPSHNIFGPVDPALYYFQRLQLGKRHPTVAYLQFQSDDLDDELFEPYSSKPVFPDPATIQWPDKDTLKATLPRKYHAFLANTYIKDCRMWLWKCPMGRRARELLAQVPSYEKICQDSSKIIEDNKKLTSERPPPNPPQMGVQKSNPNILKPKPFMPLPLNIPSPIYPRTRSGHNMQPHFSRTQK